MRCFEMFDICRSIGNPPAKLQIRGADARVPDEAFFQGKFRPYLTVNSTRWFFKALTFAEIFEGLSLQLPPLIVVKESTIIVPHLRQGEPRPRMIEAASVQLLYGARDRRLYLFLHRVNTDVLLRHFYIHTENQPG
jgi:hypothetical protein